MKNLVENTSERAGLDALLPGPYLIEAQEARGQAQLTDSDVLPMQMDEPRASYEALGFAFGGQVQGDPLFVYAKLPAGWRKEGTHHAMHSRILDSAGRERVHIFYKAAFYDRRAHMGLVGRYSIEHEYLRDTCFDIKSTRVEDRATGAVLQRWDGDARKAALAWLYANRPSWRDPVQAWADAP